MTPRVIYGFLFLCLMSGLIAHDLPLLKYEKRLSSVRALATQINDDQTRKELLYELERIREYYFSIPGFQTKEYLDKQTTLIQHAVSAFLLKQRRYAVNERKIGNRDHQNIQLSLGRKQLGFIKERPEKNKEIICWDLSLLFGCSEYLAPTLSVSFDGFTSSYQPYINAKIHKQLFQDLSHCFNRHERVSLVSFWKINLLSYVIGHLDLVSPNIPITKQGMIILFDNEDTLTPTNTIQGSKWGLSLPLVNYMVEWPQAERGLSEEEAKELNALVIKWKGLDLHAYWNHPYTKIQLSEDEKRALEERVNTLIQYFPISEGMTYSEFFTKLFPTIFNGMEEILPTVQRITNQNITPYSALVFISSCRSWWENLSEADNQLLLNWVDKYHGDQRK